MSTYISNIFLFDIISLSVYDVVYILKNRGLTMRKIEDDSERKLTNITIRVRQKDMDRIKRACYRDEMKPTLFAYESIMSSLERLIEKQERVGYKCAQPI